MVMVLPRDIPTLQMHRTKRYTRPDNVFISEQLLTHLIRCNVDATWRPPCTDHFPITIMIDLPTTKTKTKPTFNFKMMEWENFQEELEKKLPELQDPGEINLVSDLEEQIECLTRILQELIKAAVPVVKVCSHMKRWWNRKLEMMKKELNKLNWKSYLWKHTPEHPAFQEYKCLWNRYSEAILRAKRTHWEDFLEEAMEQEMWTASHYLTEPTGDRGNPRIPALKMMTLDRS
ncbi:hypothetical protein P691DRAFT_683472 [Macrolepiota fuliginosa MF-IS2]|uniref:Endonuclease/exonuclease/phosphatase domain-containing protein n=1 Tax=Macrolepiota fuliginosa MF-IS2 TaxID=1400762 RepID=A0A9P5X168_9AGAR|nr:hypothetical protein P691DRAFT_683472 [Macrolepiota fuliginosa MF-IS2]